jgi:hypothetical protein
MKWPIIIILIALVILTMTNQKTGQKESKYSFRCSEDNTAVEMYSLDSDAFTVWQSCTNGCEIGSQGLMCTPSPEVPQKQSTPVTSYLPVLLAIGGVYLYSKWRKRK